jgi:hypothetical protein
MARFYIRAALAYHDLGDFTEDAVATNRPNHRRQLTADLT